MLLRPWIRGGYTFTSTGDDDPTDDKHKTFFQALAHTPHLRAHAVLQHDEPERHVPPNWCLRPHKKLTIRTDVHGLRLAQSNDLWYAGGGAFNPWVFGYAGRPSLGGRGPRDTLRCQRRRRGHLKTDPQRLLRLRQTESRSWPPSTPDGKNMSFGYLELSYKF